jgi:hypothetical protein
MADIEQRVIWSLDQACELRSEASSSRPFDVETILNPVVQYERALRDGGEGCELVGDILVTSTRSLNDPFQLGAARSLGYPRAGWSVVEAFEKYGGPEGLFHCCGGCPANVSGHRLAGCKGSFYFDPDSVPLNEFLVATVGRLGLGESYRECFRMTNPLWYGLWINRELDSAAQVVLLHLFEALVAWGQSKGKAAPNGEVHAGFSEFVGGIRKAQSQSIPLKVELLPPGRQVLDLVTTFPHCPACRASACDQVWQRHYPVALQACSACETSFSPAETVGALRVSDRGEALYDRLGSDQFRELVVTYLIRRGCPADETLTLVDSIEKTIREEREFEGRLDEIRAKQRRFLQTRVFHGLSSVSPPPSEIVEESVCASSRIEDQVWFDSESFEMVLERVVRLGVTVRYMTHASPGRSLERHVWENIDDPLALLKKWREDGCCGKFSALLIVPSGVLEKGE